MSSEEQQPQSQKLSLKIQYLKLKRIDELNNKLKQELGRDRITASNACLSIIDYATTHRDYALAEIWGYPPPGSNPFRENINKNLRRGGSVQDTNNCCAIM